MEFTIKTQDENTTISKLKTGCLVLGLYEDHTGYPASLAPCLKKALASGDFSGKAGSTLLLRDLPDMQAARLLLVGLGTQEKIAPLKTVIQAVAQVLSTLGSKNAHLALPFAAFKTDSTQDEKNSPAYAVRAAVLYFRENAYCFEQCKTAVSRPKNTSVTGAQEIIFLLEKSAASVAKNALAQGLAIADGIALAKDLGNLPGNICTPTYLAKHAEKMVADFQKMDTALSLRAEILEKKQMEALKMHSLLSVTRGSEEAPKFIILHYQHPASSAPPVVLVGKGVTFDAGGISLKPGANMDEMKFDMCGAAAVLGVFHALVALKTKMHLIVVIPATENLPSGRATKPGDIVTSLSGQTIEILNTDAEGRLILCDALTYVERFDPALVIDIATLTGACVTALGYHHSGLFTRHDSIHDALAQGLLAAGRATEDTVWRMPIEQAYQEQLKSPFADMANIGGPAAGSITAACFLERYTRKYPWAHLDIAGTAWKRSAPKGATGRGVALLTEFLLQRSNQKFPTP